MSRCSLFFFSSRNLVLSRFESLFPTTKRTDEGSEEDEPTDGFYEHWGWAATIFELSDSSILSVTGDTSIPKLNFVFVLNWLAYHQDKNQREEQRRKQQERQYRIK